MPAETYWFNEGIIFPPPVPLEGKCMNPVTNILTFYFTLRINNYNDI